MGHERKFASGEFIENSGANLLYVGKLFEILSTLKGISEFIVHIKGYLNILIDTQRISYEVEGF